MIDYQQFRFHIGLDRIALVRIHYFSQIFFPSHMRNCYALSIVETALSSCGKNIFLLLCRRFLLIHFKITVDESLFLCGKHIIHIVEYTKLHLSERDERT